ncbi:MAG: YibE/F family protein, partial [Treponema sp.]|nr:YibE/F family protein [Treponema sp.]
VTGIIALIMDRALFLTGLVDGNARFLVNLQGAVSIDLRAIIFAGIIIGAMGAIMDVALSIASSLWEIKEKARSIKFETLFRSGLTIGRDIMGSMANTLILAYIGTSLSVVLLLTVYSDSLFSLLNQEMIVVEVLKSLSGILGILFAMPLTAFFCAILYLKKGRGAAGLS